MYMVLLLQYIHLVVFQGAQRGFLHSPDVHVRLLSALLILQTLTQGKYYVYKCGTVSLVCVCVYMYVSGNCAILFYSFSQLMYLLMSSIYFSRS